jgi:hypothetical protein
VLVYTVAAELPVRMVTLLAPRADAGAEPPLAFPLVAEDAGVAGLILQGGRQLVLIDEEEPRLSPGPAVTQ